MLKNAMLVGITVFASAQAFAASPTYVCSLASGGSGFGYKLNVTVKSKTSVELEGGDATAVGSGKGTLDPKYKPRPQNAGSTRYAAKNSCGEYFIIFDKDMSRGKAGRMILQQDCDSDGTGPSFYTYRCEK